MLRDLKPKQLHRIHICDDSACLFGSQVAAYFVRVVRRIEISTLVAQFLLQSMTTQPSTTNSR